MKKINMLPNGPIFFSWSDYGSMFIGLMVYQPMIVIGRQVLFIYIYIYIYIYREREREREMVDLVIPTRWEK